MSYYHPSLPLSNPVRRRTAAGPLFLGLEAIYAGAPPQRISAPFQTRLGAVAFIFLPRKQQRQGWQPLGWLQQEAMHPALISLKQEAIYVAVVFDFPKVVL